MTTEISVRPGEQGSIDLLITLSVTPDTLLWSLKDGAGTVINSRTAVEIDSPTASETVKLSGDDLAIFTDEPLSAPKRYFYLWGTFTDGALTRKISKEAVLVPTDYLSVAPVDRS